MRLFFGFKPGEILLHGPAKKPIFHFFLHIFRLFYIISHRVLYYWPQGLKFCTLQPGMPLVLFFRSFAFCPAMQLPVSPKQFIPTLKSAKTAFMQFNIQVIPPAKNSFTVDRIIYWHSKDAKLIFIR
jgi:hypothetical protein